MLHWFSLAIWFGSPKKVFREVFTSDGSSLEITSLYNPDSEIIPSEPCKEKTVLSSEIQNPCDFNTILVLFWIF